MTDRSRIYVADLAAYNNGIIHGAWIDLLKDPASIQDEIKNIFERSPIADAEEYAIHDYENFGGYRVGEFESIDELCEIAKFLADFPEFGGELLSILGNFEEARRIAEHEYCGLHRSVADYAQELTEGCGEVPDHLAPYIDYQAMGRDWELSGDLLTVVVGFERVHIFNNV
jgi:antirestriction protein